MRRPILTVVTRHMPSKRATLINRLNESLDPIRSEIQHLIVEDNECAGLRESAKKVIAQRSQVKGEYVLILDDDDTFTCPQLPVVLRRIKKYVDPNLIIVKNWMPRHGILPNPEIWESKDIMQFRVATIGMPGFILHHSMYEEFVHYMATADIRVDWQIFRAIQNANISRNFNVYWLDLLIMVQPEKLDCRGEEFEESIDTRILFKV